VSRRVLLEQIGDTIPAVRVRFPGWIQDLIQFPARKTAMGVFSNWCDAFRRKKSERALVSKLPWSRLECRVLGTSIKTTDLIGRTSCDGIRFVESFQAVMRIRRAPNIFQSVVRRNRSEPPACRRRSGAETIGITNGPRLANDFPAELLDCPSNPAPDVGEE